MSTAEEFPIFKIPNKYVLEPIALWDNLLPWHMHSTRNSATINLDRTEPYIFRGAKDRDPLKQDKLDALEAIKVKRETTKTMRKKYTASPD
ncbi:hypothetical protein [uncultured Sphaerochaeta sp.]|uniref:hypothetical protein n=1 Tax=uncultured Sphaerochaeta sp. TaxID=886478 RepID=UPI002A0A1949|nr:hypothetical protein [uncultured Sphaerochaeta sp.]